ncbi:uncharacterized protein [Elaeis guineensis]|uniref:Uncharacterized protein LOC105035431 n=1 Tax=Elaeis guineensis var. tenera TaxID=51953 RepID=A0A6I9QGY5_ELAGV|nr:uncharacterized protein LOC105035431 [Elaeis guineensis]
MVLWEMTVITAYFLGLKRTYRIALRIQRRLVGPNHPKIRQFLSRRTRNVFDVAVKVHKNIQQRDIEVGRSLGNWILRWLDRMKPSAQIRPRPPVVPTNGTPKHITSPGRSLGAQRPNHKITDKESNGRSLFTPLNKGPNSFPTVSMMMQPTRPASLGNQYRHIFYFQPHASALDKKQDLLGVFRKDIAQWMLH